jgi:protein TonB
MNGTSNGRIVRIALAGSIAVHLIFASVVHSPRVTAAQPQKPTPGRIIEIHLPKPTPTPTPPPTHPKHVVHQRAPHASRPHVHLIHQLAKAQPSAPPEMPPGPESTASPDIGMPGSPEPSAAPIPPTPSPTPKPACSAPDVPAKAVDAISPQTPPDVSAVSVTAKIRVDLDAAGAVTGASVYESTGYPQLDRAALEAARESRYAPEEKNCRDVSGSYLFTVDFSQ